MLKIGFFQFEPRFGVVEENLERVVSGLHDVEADLVVLPELAFTGYLFENRRELLSLAEDPADSPTVERLRLLCHDRDLFLVTGFAERQGDQVFNSALLIGPDGLVQTYRKLHLFNTEKEYFDPGDTPLEPVEVRDIMIGMMVCFDWAFPETARVLALKGADILCHPSNLVLPLCQQAMVTRCLENGVFAVTANRIGSDTRPRGSLRFTGQSQVVTPKGDILHRATADREELSIMEIEVNLARSKKMTEKNDLFEDRRPSFYTPLIDRKMGSLTWEMNPENVIRAYLSGLEEGDSSKILQLFAEDGVVVSRLYGEAGASEFFPRLFRDTLESKNSLQEIYHSSWAQHRFAAHFIYDWKLRDGTEVSFVCTDVFELDGNSGKIRKLSIIYDSRQTRSAVDGLKKEA